MIHLAFWWIFNVKMQYDFLHIVGPLMHIVGHFMIMLMHLQCFSLMIVCTLNNTASRCPAILFINYCELTTVLCLCFSPCFPLCSSWTAHQDEGSLCPRGQEVMTVTVWTSMLWRSALMLSTTTSSADSEKKAEAAEEEDTKGRLLPGAGVSANRPSRTGSAGRTGTARRERRATCLT